MPFSADSLPVCVRIGRRFYQARSLFPTLAVDVILGDPMLRVALITLRVSKGYAELGTTRGIIPYTPRRSIRDEGDDPQLERER